MLIIKLKSMKSYAKLNYLFNWIKETQIILSVIFYGVIQNKQKLHKLNQIYFVY